MAHRRWLLAAVSIAALVPPGTVVRQALAEEVSSGGASVPEAAELRSLACKTAWRCATGQRLTVTGKGLDGVESVEFLGGRGASDNRTARPRQASATKLTLTVPAGARTGRVRAVTYAGTVAAPQKLTIDQGAGRRLGTSATSDGVFPIDGSHDMGQSPTNGFGGGRGHQGHDMFARCGTPLVAVLDATVQFVGSQSNAGNYLVLQDAAGQSYAYMHLRDRALVRKGDTVVAGERVGFVGQTGRATGCHLHFELWTAPGWYTGGEAIDPLPQLRAWEREHRSEH
jgi:murein DD-endopeptidase MepM/ murein hydrolase activator NlpD